MKLLKRGQQFRLSAKIKWLQNQYAFLAATITKQMAQNLGSK